MSTLRCWSLDEDGVRALGAAVGSALAVGDVVALVGPLGAGKSALARAAVYGAGVSERVRVASPTFTVVQEYLGRIPVHHADLYRLGFAEELDEIGLFDRGADAAMLIEWADRFPERIPADAMWLELEIVDEARREVRARGEGARVERLVRAASRGVIPGPVPPR